jgi:two-component sensor histidine kinase
MLYKVDGRPLRMIGVRIDVTDRKKAEDHKKLLVSELDHRVKNTLAAVIAMGRVHPERVHRLRYPRDGNTLIEGPDIHLTADAVQVLAIVLHELTTNAAKYGALSNGAGRVSVHWDWCSKESLSGGVILRWRETGGPTVSASAEPGYGTEVIRDLIPYELGGSVDYVLEASGVRCKVEIPDKWLTGGTRRLDA